MAEDKPLSNFLLPKHELVPADDRGKMLKDQSVRMEGMPKIKAKDPAIAQLGARNGDMVKITREDPTGKNVYYRLVTGGE